MNTEEWTVAINDVFGAMGVAMSQAMEAITAAAPAILEAWYGVTYPRLYDQALEYQHARIVAGCLCPWAPIDDPNPVLGAIVL